MAWLNTVPFVTMQSVATREILYSATHPTPPFINVYFPVGLFRFRKIPAKALKFGNFYDILFLYKLKGDLQECTGSCKIRSLQ